MEPPFFGGLLTSRFQRFLVLTADQAEPWLVSFHCFNELPPVFSGFDGPVMLRALGQCDGENHGAHSQN